MQPIYVRTIRIVDTGCTVGISRTVGVGRNGWTLIEAMVSMALGLLCTLMLIAGWQWNYRAFIQTTQLSELQQSAQFVLSFMQQELLNQNFWAGFQLEELPPTTLMTPTADCSGPLDSGSFPKLHQGFVGIYSGTVGHIGTPGCLTVARKGSDFLQLKRLAGAPVFKAELKANRVYLQQYQRHASFVALHSSGLYPAATYWPYVHQLWYVALQKHEGKNIPVLMRKRLVRQLSGQLAMDTSSVIDGVEMLHFELGVDSNFDGQMDYSKPSDQIPDAVWLGQSGKIIQLRFYVLLRSITADLTYTNVQQYQLGQRLYKAPGDQYRRLLVSSAVTFNNL
ncbi:PilW family protein [Rheinheimera sp. SA_1]|uniref:PilW family protein n=1 Tax=Rheinheimera sp. SA_1 TaxID=1827365 RepID=UPI000A7F24FB|nr:PilW family protein [Rheinheimera sp. SA_1]